MLLLTLSGRRYLAGLFTGQELSKPHGSGGIWPGQEVLKSHRSGRVGSGQEALKSRGSGLIGSRGFEISRAGSGRVRRFLNLTGSGRVMTRGVRVISRIGPLRPASLFLLTRGSDP